MKVTDLIVEVRNSSLARVGQILPVDLVGFQAVLRFCKVGTWELPLHASSPMADALRAPGAGIVVTGPNGVLFSGPTTGATKSQTQDNPLGEWMIRGVTDEVILGERLAYPTPATADVSLQTTAYDTRTGVASTIMYGYVDANIGPSAPAARKISALTLAADPAVGSSITGNARFQTLGALLGSLATFNLLGFTIKQSGSNLQFAVYQPTDRSGYIRMDVDNDMLVKSEYTYQAPEATRVIVAGQGAGASRTLIERTSSSSTTAETAWGRRIEVFKDQRSSSAAADLQQAGDEILADKGKTLEAISVSPSDDTTMAYGTDWGLGDKVSVVAGSTTIVQIVTEVGIKVDADGVRVGATVGEPAVADEESTVAEVQADQEERITNLEVNTATPAAQSPNYLINSAFEIWSNGTTGTPTSAANVYVADLWESFRGAYATGLTVSRQSAGLDGFQYCARIQRTAANADGTIIYTGQPLKTADSLLSVGKSVTLSFYARAGANYSSAANGMIVQLRQGTGTDQTMRGGFTGNVNIVAQTATLTTSWQLFTYTATMATSATQLGVMFSYTPVGTAGANDYFEVTGVQLEQGSIATPYRRNAPSLQAETVATNSSFVPTGAMMMWYTSTAPAGWQICDGSASGSTALASVIGANTPDMRTRVPVGKAASGTFASLGAVGGAETVVLSATHLPAHTHSGQTGNETVDHTHNHGLGTGFSLLYSNRTAATQASGGTSARLSGYLDNTAGASQPHKHNFTTDGGSGLNGTAHDNLQPYIVINYIIKL